MIGDKRTGEIAAAPAVSGPDPRLSRGDWVGYLAKRTLLERRLAGGARTVGIVKTHDIAFPYHTSAAARFRVTHHPGACRKRPLETCI